MLRAGIISVLALVMATSFVLHLQGLTFAAPLLGQVGVPTDPAAVLQRFQDAADHGDVDAAMQLVSNDIRYVGGAACTEQYPCLGARTFRRVLELSIANQVRTTTVGAAKISGTTVRVRTLTASPGRSAIGVDRTLAEVTAEVADGILVSFRSEPDRDDAQTLWWLDHQSALHRESSSSRPAVGSRGVISQAPPVSLRVMRLDVDTYFDRGRGLVVLTNDCVEPAPGVTNVLLRAPADPGEPELAFPFGQDCPVTFIGAGNAYLTSAGYSAYRDVLTGEEFATADCPNLSSTERALIHFDQVIVLGDQPVACHLAA